jgi:DegV family protein with EDD domain
VVLSAKGIRARSGDDKGNKPSEHGPIFRRQGTAYMSKRIGIVVDSPADFPEGMIEDLGIHVLPVHIFVDGKDHLHGVDISNKEVSKHLKDHRKVYTRPFFPGECADFFERLCERYDKIFSFHISDQLSGNFKSAKSSIHLLFEDQAAKLNLIDTGNVSVGQGLMVKKALELLKDGSSTFDLETRLEPYKRNSFLFIAVDNLYWLKEGGRVSSFSAFLGGMLDIKPIITLSNSKLIPIEKHRGKRQALDRIIEMGAQTAKSIHSDFELWVGHLDATDDALYVRDRVSRMLGKSRAEITVLEVGPTIAVHAGPGSLCLGMLPKAEP